MSHFEEPNPATHQPLQQHYTQSQYNHYQPNHQQQIPSNTYIQPYHHVYNPGTNFLMHKYDYNPRLLFDNFQNLLEKNLQPDTTTSTASRSLPRQSSIDINNNNNNNSNIELQQIDLARIKLDDIDYSNCNTVPNQTNKQSNLSKNSLVDDFNRIEIDSNSVSMLNDVNEELILSIINDSKNNSANQQPPPKLSNTSIHNLNTKKSLIIFMRRVLIIR